MSKCENCKYQCQGDEELPCTNCDDSQKGNHWEKLIGTPVYYTEEEVIEMKGW